LWHRHDKILAARVVATCGQPMLSYQKSRAGVKWKAKKQFDQRKNEMGWRAQSCGPNSSTMPRGFMINP
jgi:hypothetical protein